MALLWFEIFDDGHQKKYFSLILNSWFVQDSVISTCHSSEDVCTKYHYLHRSNLLEALFLETRYSCISGILQFAYLLYILLRNKSQINRCIIPSADQILPFIPFLAFLLPKCEFNILLLRPFLFTDSSFHFKNFIKMIVIKHSEYRRNIRNIFMHSPSVVNSWHDLGFKKARWICDPPLLDRSYVESENFPSCRHPETYVFLIFGHISSRKNVPQIIHSLTSIKKHFPVQKICLKIVGTISPEYLSVLNNLVTEVKPLNPFLHVEFYPGFHSEDILSDFINQCDAIIAYYSHHKFSSSGVLSIAAEYAKPILVAGNTYISQVVNQYNLGISCERDDELTSAFNFLMGLSRRDFVRRLQRDSFLSVHNSSSFSHSILTF